MFGRPVTIPFRAGWTWLLVVLIFLSVISENEADCKYKPCRNGDAHTMCLYPPKLDTSKEKCSGKEAKAGLTNELRKAILDKHNELRQMVAQGKAQGQPKAADMMKLTWNSEVEAIAQRFVNSCPDVGHDRCRNLLDGTAVGQNSGNNYLKYKEHPNKSEVVLGPVNAWFSEVKNMEPQYIDDFSSVPFDSNKPIGHYTQLVWAETTRLGCGYLEYNYDGPTFQYILLDCDYAVAGNLVNKGTKVYTKGEPCSQCPEGAHCSKRFPGLCTMEEDEDKDIPSNKDDKGTGSVVHGGAFCSVVLVVVLNFVDVFDSIWCSN